MEANETKNVATEEVKTPEVSTPVKRIERKPAAEPVKKPEVKTVEKVEEKMDAVVTDEPVVEPEVKTDDEKKLAEQKERFCLKHKCKACGQPMSYIGGNQMTCTNDKCKGIKVEREDKEGNKIVSYVVSYELLDNKGAEIGNIIFS
jgi:hypothetical protein